MSTIFSNATAEGGILHSDPLVLNLVLANVVPAFAPLSENSSAGYARIDANGIVGYVGDNLLTFQNGRDIIASVMAHEIGHNLGLNHTGSGQANLMSPGGSTEELNSSQIAEARSSSFARAVPSVLTGDYNRDGAVNAADYVVWRKTFNQVAPGLPADGNSNGWIDESDYQLWRTNFGRSGTAGLAASVTGDAELQFVAVPEPASAGSAVAAILVMVAMRGRRRQSLWRGCMMRDAGCGAWLIAMTRRQADSNSAESSSHCSSSEAS